MRRKDQTLLKAEQLWHPLTAASCFSLTLPRQACAIMSRKLDPVNRLDHFDTWFPQLSGNSYYMCIGIGGLYSFPEILDFAEWFPLELLRTTVERYDFDKHHARTRREGIVKVDTLLLVR